MGIKGGNIIHPDFPAKKNKWNVMVTSHGVTGCVGSYRWFWRARITAHSIVWRWPGEKTVRIVRGT